MKDTVRTEHLLSEEEKARRKASIDFARRSVKYEGVILGDEIEALNEKYINGVLTLKEHTQAGLELLKRNNTDG